MTYLVLLIIGVGVVLGASGVMYFVTMEGRGRDLSGRVGGPARRTGRDTGLGSVGRPLLDCNVVRDVGGSAAISQLAQERARVEQLESTLGEVGDLALETESFSDEVRHLRSALASANAWLHDARLQRDRATCDLAAIDSLINTPLTHDFFDAVRKEAAHQIRRWGSEYDARKRAEDWIVLVAHLVGKATSAHYDCDLDKLRHHVVTVAAACMNWLGALNDDTVKDPSSTAALADCATVSSIASKETAPEKK